jgi:AraC-like DNA-binding protein
MQPSLDFIAVLLFAGVVQGAFLAVALLIPKRRDGNRVANRILSLLLALFAGNIILHTLAYTQYLFRFPQLAKVDAPLTFLVAPLFYFYVRALTKKDFRFEATAWLHFIPFVLCAAFFVPFYLQPAAEKIRHLRQIEAAPCAQCRIVSWLLISQMLVYFVAAFRILQRHQENIKSAFSSLEKINLNWLRYLLVVYAVDWLAVLAWQLSGGGTAFANYLWLFVSVVMYAIGYKSLQQPEIFAGIDETAVPEATAKKKYEKSTLTPDRAEAYYQKLLQVMATEKPHRQRDLSLPKLAQRLSMSTHHLSQIINERLQQNFFEFVNKYRIEDAKSLLLDQANINVAEIGFEAGFSSVSAFNTAFKKYTGMPPSQFRREQKNQEKLAHGMELTRK